MTAMTTTLMTRLTSRRLVAIAVSLLSLAPAFAQAGVTMIGTMAAWQGAPAQTLDDKVFTYIASGGGWNGSELIFVSSNATLDIHSLNLDTLTTYTGPLTLTVEYRIDISSNNVFAAIGLDTDTLSPTTSVYKDVFSDPVLLEESVGLVGGGDLAALSSINGFPSVASLPAIQQIWIRDTIQLNASGQLNSVSNSVLQTVPEPSGIALAGLAVAALAARRLRSRGRAT